MHDRLTSGDQRVQSMHHRRLKHLFTRNKENRVSKIRLFKRFNRKVKPFADEKPQKRVTPSQARGFQTPLGGGRERSAQAVARSQGSIQLAHAYVQ